MAKPFRAPWTFPVPVRRSRFVGAPAKWDRLNVEVALDRVGAFAFDDASMDEVLYFDYQTQLDGTYFGRHGSGRGGVYRGHYLKGVGRTFAAGNWNDSKERYHGSGHLSVSSAVREFLITSLLRKHGLGDSIVPCETVLFAALRPAERAWIAKGHTSAQCPADNRMMALSAKPANFARMSNIVWAFDHFTGYLPELGELILAFEQFLHPPQAREGLEGDPTAIAKAMDAAFHRGLENFRAWARLGLFWLYLQNNFTLDGRYVDLETPFYIGVPMVGWLERPGREPECQELGFEEFSFVAAWRMFLGWLDSKLRFLGGPVMRLDPMARSILNGLRGAIGSQFRRDQHLLYDDRLLIHEAVTNVAASRTQVEDLRRVAEGHFRSAVYGKAVAISKSVGVTTLPFEIEAPFRGEFRVCVPRVMACESPSPAAQAFAAGVRGAEAISDPRKILTLLSDLTASSP
jgi:hypothetical protein